MKSLIVRLVVLLAIPTSTSAEPLPDRAVTLANKFLATHLPVLALDVVGVRIDLPRTTAKLRVGGGDARLAQLRISGDVEVVDGTAQIHTRIALGCAGQRLAFALPEVDVMQSSFRDHVDKPERGVEVVMPLARARF